MPLTQTTFWNTGTENKYRSSLNKQVIIMLVMLNSESKSLITKFLFQDIIVFKGEKLLKTC